MQPLWGVDLGGTKIEGVVLKSASSPQVISRLRIPTEAAQGYDYIIAQIARLIELLVAQTGTRPERLGIGTPGALDTQT